MIKSNPAKFALPGLIVAITVLFSAFAKISSAHTIEELLQGSLDLPVPPIQQYLGTSCGEAVITMIYNYSHPQDPINELDVIDYASERGYYNEEKEPFTSPADMVKLARHYSDSVASGRVLTRDQGLKLLYGWLQDGKPVIIDIPAVLSDLESSAHFVVVTGISMDGQAEDSIVIHYNDPLSGTKESAVWEGEAGIWNGWLNNSDPGGSGWWMVIRIECLAKVRAGCRLSKS